MKREQAQKTRKQEPSQMILNLSGVQFSNPDNKLTDLEKKVFNLLPVGKENAVSAEYISNVLNISKRTVTRTVRNLHLKSFDVGSNRDDGYYRLRDTQEYLEYMSSSSQELARREQVHEAMRYTPLARKITIDVNQDSQKTRKKE